MADSLGTAVMTFGGDDGPFQQAAFRVERGMVSLANTAARSLGSALEDMGAKVRAGQAAFTDLFAEGIKGIPLVGGFVAFGVALADVAIGGKSAADALKLQTEEMAKQIDLVAKLTASHEKLLQAQRNSSQQLALGFAGKNIGANFSALFGNPDASTATEAQVREEVRARFKVQLDAITEEKKKLADKLRDTQNPSLNSFLFGSASPVKPDQGAISELQKQFNEAEKRAKRLREDITAEEEKAVSKLGGGALTKLGSLAGGEFVKQLDNATAAVKRLFNAGRESTFDEALRSMGNLVKQYAPIVETIARLADSNLGISNFARNAANAIGGVFPGRVSPKGPAPFRASFVGLEDLGRNIQAAAGSGRDETLDGILEAARGSLAEQQKQTALLKQQRGPIGP